MAVQIKSPQNEWTVGRQPTVWVTNEGATSFTLQSNEGASSYTLEINLTLCEADQVPMLQSCNTHLHYDKDTFYRDIPVKTVTLEAEKLGTFMATHAVPDPAGSCNIYFIELFGKFRMYDCATGNINDLVDLKPELGIVHAEFDTDTQLYEDHYNGLLGLALTSDFASSQEYYISYSTSADSLSASEQESLLSACGMAETVINHFDNVVHCKNLACTDRDLLFQTPNPGFWHNGGDIILDGTDLYFAIGDAGGRW